MGDKITTYPNGSALNLLGKIDVSNTIDGGLTYDSEAYTLSQLLSFVNSNGSNIYNLDGSILVNRTLTSNGSWTKWIDGDIIIEPGGETVDVGFILNDLSSSEVGRFAYNLSSLSAEIILSNNSGEFFKVSDENMFVNTNDFVVTDSGRVGIGTSTPAADTWFHVMRTANSPKYLRMQNDSSGSSALASVMVVSDSAVLQMTCQSTGRVVDPGTSQIKASNSDLILNASSSGRDIYFRTQSTNKMVLTNGGSLGLGTDMPDTKAIIDLTSTTMGFLPPRMTTVQRDAISTSSFGLMIYNTTTSKMNFHNGLSWEEITSA